MSDSDDRARPLLLAQAAKRDAMEWRYDDVEPVISRLLADIDRLRQQVEKARAMGRDEGLEEAREANRKLHRRAQIAEGMKDSFYGIVDIWARVIRGSHRKAPEKICWGSYKLGQLSGIELVYYDLDKRCKRALKSGEGG